MDIDRIAEGIANAIPIDGDIGLAIAVLTKMAVQVTLLLVIGILVLGFAWIIFAITITILTGDRKAPVKIVTKLKRAVRELVAL